MHRKATLIRLIRNATPENGLAMTGIFHGETIEPDQDISTGLTL
ncbi:MAG: hypothetical protein AB7T74_16730 [Clostridia bacterium]